MCAFAAPTVAAASAHPDAVPEPAPDFDPDVEPPPIEDDAVEIIEVEGTAPAESASSVHFHAAELAQRPHATASDLMRQVPGLVVAQHAGGGKSDQYFLRGFDADHGTDVAIFVDGVPVNLTSHGHGQGYADSHWIIPETIATLDMHKGPYSARFGDFYTAGALDMQTLDRVDGARVAASLGTELAGPVAFDDLTTRLLAMTSPTLSSGSALVAADMAYTDGPFLDSQRFRRGNGFAKLVTPVGAGELTASATFYAARWNQSGQLPSAEVDAGRLDRFGAIDPTEGGTSSRASASLRWAAGDNPSGRLALRAYAVDYRLRLFSNFTLFARDPEHGDQIEQTDARSLYGVDATYQRAHDLGGRSALLVAGAQLRADNIEADLWHTAARERLADCFEEGANPCNRTSTRVRNVALYAEEGVSVTPWLEVLAGLRADLFVWDVTDLDPETDRTPQTTGGFAQSAIASPKLSAILRPHRVIDVFVNSGTGFHSNDARAAVSSDGGDALARGYGAEVGARVRPRRGLSAAIDAWYLYLTSELVWSGDAGGTEAAEATERMGVDLDARWLVTPWLTLDANLAFARSTLVANRGNGGGLALAPRLMGSGGVTFQHGPTMAALRARGIGDRPASDDGSLTAEGYLIVDLVASHRRGPFTVGLTVQNLLDADWREAQFAETSRVSPAAEEREDVHFTPGGPLSAMVTLEIAR